jgi:nucleoside-diphosphate-sugar epimerase
MTDHHITASFIVAGAGFIESHLTYELLRRSDQEVVVFDSFPSHEPARASG